MLYYKFNKSYFVNVPREFHPLHDRIPHAEASHVIGTAIKKNETPKWIHEQAVDKKQKCKKDACTYQ